MKKVRRPQLTRQQTLSILMATVDGINNLAPLAPPVVAALTELPAPRRQTVDEAWTALRSGGQLLDSLLFSTAYAGYVTVTGAGAELTGVTITDGGTVYVQSSGRILNITQSGGEIGVLWGGTATSVCMYGGTMGLKWTDSLGNPSIANSTTVSGGFFYLDSGGTASNTVIYNGYQTINGATSSGVFVGGVDVSGTIYSGGIQSVYGGAPRPIQSYPGAHRLCGSRVFRAMSPFAAALSLSTMVLRAAP